MRVDLAAPGELMALHTVLYYLHAHSLQVLSASVAHAMELMDDPETTETIRFVCFFDRFFDCLNVSSPSEGRQARKPDLYPYRTPNDKRFTVDV